MKILYSPSFLGYCLLWNSLHNWFLGYDVHKVSGMHRLTHRRTHAKTAWLKYATEGFRRRRHNTDDICNGVQHCSLVVTATHSTSAMSLVLLGWLMHMRFKETGPLKLFIIILCENCFNIINNWYTQHAYDVIKLQYYKTVVYIQLPQQHWNWNMPVIASYEKLSSTIISLSSKIMSHCKQ